MRQQTRSKSFIVRLQTSARDSLCANRTGARNSSCVYRTSAPRKKYCLWPQSSTASAFPASIKSGWKGVFESDIDAAVNWGNGKVYFFKGDEYIRFDVDDDSADSDYPRAIKDGWSGLFSSDISDDTWNSSSGGLFEYKEWRDLVRMDATGQFAGAPLNRPPASAYTHFRIAQLAVFKAPRNYDCAADFEITMTMRLVRVSAENPSGFVVNTRMRAFEKVAKQKVRVNFEPLPGQEVSTNSGAPNRMLK